MSLQIDVLMSLQKPKKIVIRGSDGKEYTMMCKPKVRTKVCVDLTLLTIPIVIMMIF